VAQDEWGAHCGNMLLGLRDGPHTYSRKQLSQDSLRVAIE